jgi:prepilin-type N-terminal cleavage/methylation domain-containing protein
MKRGFTLIEVMIVIVVISILATVSVVVFTQYQNRAATAQMKSLAAAVYSGAERYFDANNEYPSAQLLYNAAPSCTGTPSYATTYAQIDVPINTLNGSSTHLQPYAGSNCSWDKKLVYYLTKTTADGTTARSYVFGSCTYTFPTTDNGAVSFLLVYWSSEENVWKVIRSNNGNVATSNTTTCPFTAL